MGDKIIPKILLLEDNAIYSVNVSKKPFKDFRVHSHDFYEFEYVMSGEGVLTVNGREYSIRRGDMCFVTPFDEHSYRSKKELKLLTVHFKLNNNESTSDMDVIDACVTKCNKAMINAFEILAEACDNEELYEQLCSKTLELIAVLFLQKVKTEKKNTSNEITRAVEYMNLNFRNDISLKEISRYVGYSQEHFSRQFKRYTGKNFIKYLTDIRLLHAEKLLLESELTITVICYECGFGCPKSFNRAFKEKYGCSPLNYRNQSVSKNNN